ncbi:YmaF family protein [Acetonema longum]|uniref:YmaF family protein n=1 Tax=Acetonema longum TaxID=2374 RepID=UPI0009077B98|nr:YmaF family protein [Acetonema longum]
MSDEEDRGYPMHKPNKEEAYMEHVHLTQTMADVACEHQHLITGTSGTPIRKGRSHVHRICFRTSYDPKGGECHWHMVDVMTGPAIDIGGCDEHTHCFAGKTSYDVGHCHDFCSVTDASPECCEEEEEHECHCYREDQ